MKIGISLNPYGDTYGRYGNDKFSVIRKHGYNAVDYDIADTTTELYSLNDRALIQRVNAEKNLAESAGIEICQAHGPWRWPPQDNSVQERKERLEKMKKAVIISNLLGCNKLVIHPLMPYGIEDVKIQKEKETWDLNLVFFRELTSFAKQYGVIICLENMPMNYFSIATPQQILAFVKEINDDHIQICLDTGHVAVFNRLSIGDEVRRLGDYIKVLHIHDNMGDCDAHLYPTKGIINWHDFVTAINDIGFDGVLSLETLPSGYLDDNAFEEESINLCEMFKNLVLTNQK